MMLFEEEVVARKGYWRRSADKVDELSAESVQALSFTLSGGGSVSPQIKEHIKSIANQTTLLSEVCAHFSHSIAECSRSINVMQC